MYWSGRTQMMDGYPVPEALERMVEIGFTGAEICIEDIRFGVRERLLDPGYLAEIASAARTLGLSAWSYSYHGDYITDDEVLRRTIRTIELTRRVDTDVFVFSGRRFDKTKDADTQWRALVERTRLLADAAEANDVRLALETEPGFICGTTAQLLRLIDEVGSPALMCNMDIGHAFLCDPDPVAAIRALGPLIVHCHIDDMRRGVHDHLLPGDGEMDLAEILATLDQVGFDGPAALDLYGYDYESVAERALDELRRLRDRPDRD